MNHTVTGQVTVRRVNANVVYPLRHAVLRTGRRWADVIYSADTDPLSAHFAALSYPGSGTSTDRSLDSEGTAEPLRELSDDAVVLAVGSVLPDKPDWADDVDWADDLDWPGARHSPDTEQTAWRVRGMAVRPDSRGSGLGTEILGRLLAHVASNGGGTVWCTARLAAMSLYERAGLAARGDTEVLPGIGAHRVMIGFVAPDRPT